MPQTNGGYSNGAGATHHNGYEMEDGQSFLFTSESVGEGHPGLYNIFFFSLTYFK
jgi:S-adenosylmethionine synthetase